MNDDRTTDPANIRSVGRPRRLCVDDIVNAACEFPPNGLDMAGVAERLNVGVATLYGYIEGRDHLMRLVAERKTRLTSIVDRGQSWEDIVREHAANCYQKAVSWPALITELMKGGILGPEVANYLEHFMEMLTARGFRPGEISTLYYEVIQLVLGVVITSTYLNTINAKHGGHDQAMRQYLAKCASEAYPLLREGLRTNPVPPVLSSYEDALERLILDYGRRYERL